MEPSDEATPGRRRRLRLAATLWVALCVVLWNVLFDGKVRDAEVDYLTRQALHQAGHGPAVGIFQVMRPAVRQAAVTAGYWTAPVAAAGVLALLLAARRTRA